MTTAVRPTPPPAVYSAERLEGNLRVLDRVDHELAERLRLPVDGNHVVFDAAGRLLYVLHRDACELRVPEPPAELAAQRVLILGVGEGDLVDQALALAGTTEVVVWDRDPWLLRLDLMRRDRRAELASRRLVYRLGPDLLALRDWPGVVVTNPVLGSVYRLELESFRARRRSGGRSGARRALVCVGKLFVDQVAAVLRAAGFELWSLDVSRHAEEELARTMEVFAPELVFSINHFRGLAEFCHAHRARLLVWEVDPSQYPVPPCATPTDHVRVWTHRRANVEDYRRAGFTHVVYSPLAADPNVRHPLELDAAERERLGAPVSFVGNSLVTGVESCRRTFLELFAVWSNALGKDAPPDPESTRAAGEDLLRELLVAQRSSPARFRIPADLEQAAPGFRAAVMARGDAPDPALLAGELAGAEKRLGTVANLGALGIHVWGDAGWKTVTAHGARYRGSAGHALELTRIYNASTVNLDIARIYQPDIVTMRVFDCLACGAFVLAEHSDGLADAFTPGEEVDSYRTVEELRAKVAYYVEHPERARELALRGRERVLAEHTIEGRVRSMLAAM